MVYFPIIIISIVCLVALTRPVTVLFHELGHAIPAILLTKQKATIYIGTYGDPTKCLRINLGALEIFFRYNPLSWNIGLCVPSAKDISINKQIVYILAGPLTSFLLGSITSYLTFEYDLHGFLKLFLIVFLFSAFFDLIINLIPNKNPIYLYAGAVAYNDGYRLKQLFYYKRLPEEYSKAVKLYNEKKFADSAIIFESLITDGATDENIYRLTISAFLHNKNYSKVKDLSETFALTNKMNSDDLSNLALAYSYLGLCEESIELYNKSLELNPENIYSLNNKGYTLNLMKRYEEAIPYFSKAIDIDKDFTYSYSNRGLSKIKIGQAGDGLQDITHSLRLDSDNSYAYMHMGIYYFEKGEFDKALQEFIRAKELDNSTHMIDNFIIDTKSKIKV